MDKTKFDRLNAKLKAMTKRQKETGTTTVTYTRISATAIRRRKHA